MKKNHKLEWDPEFSMTNSGCLLWKTVVPNYEFVAQFNEVFGTQLTRTEEIEIFGNEGFPMFTFSSSSQQLIFFLIDNVGNKMDEAVSGFDKILIINGRDAFLKEISIYNEFYEEQMIWGEEDYLTRKHLEEMAAFRNCVARLDYFNYLGDPGRVLRVDKKRSKPGPTSIVGKTSDMADCMECLLGEIEKYYFD